MTNNKNEMQGPPSFGPWVLLQGVGISTQIRLDTSDDMEILNEAIRIADKRRYPWEITI